MSGRRVLLREQMRNHFLAFSLIPAILFCTILFIYIASAVWSASREGLTSRLSYAQERLEQSLGQAYQIGKSAGEDDAIIKGLQAEREGRIQRYTSEILLNNELSQITRYLDPKIQLYIISESGALYKSGQLSFRADEYRQTPWYEDAMRDGGTAWLSLQGNSRVVLGARGQYTALCLPIRAKGDARFLGVLLVEIQIDETLSDVTGHGGMFYIIEPSLDMRIVGERVEIYDNDVVTAIDGDRINVMSRNDPKPKYIESTIQSIAYWRDNFVQSGFLSAGGYALGYTVVKANQWILVHCVPFLVLYRVPIIIIISLLIGVLILLIFVLWAANRAAYKVTLPIMLLNQSVHMVRADNFDVMILKTNDDEIGDLSDQFNKMVRHIKKLMARIIEEQTTRRKYELLLLQAQINPHFLYNTLDSIVWLVRMKRNDDAAVMLTALTSFFRTGLNKGRDTVKLSQEVENVQSYMTIQMYRYKTRLSYRSSVSENVSALEVPKLILQPLVENAIYHGIKGKESPGTITLICKEQGLGVCITVEDDGLGIGAERLAQLRAQLETHDAINRESYGIINVYERLRLFFRTACSMRIDSEPGRGTRVTILIEREGT